MQGNISYTKSNATGLPGNSNSFLDQSGSEANKSTTPDSGGNSYYSCLKFIRKKVRNLVEMQVFEYIVLFLILASTLCLCLEDVSLKDKPVLQKILNLLEIIFTSLFTAEMILKLIAIGFKDYFRSVWNVLDFFIVATSWASLIIMWMNNSATSNVAQWGGL